MTEEEKRIQNILNSVEREKSYITFVLAFFSLIGIIATIFGFHQISQQIDKGVNERFKVVLEEKFDEYADEALIKHLQTEEKRLKSFYIDAESGIKSIKDTIRGHEETIRLETQAFLESLSKSKDVLEEDSYQEIILNYGQINSQIEQIKKTLSNLSNEFVRNKSGLDNLSSDFSEFKSNLIIESKIFVVREKSSQQLGDTGISFSIGKIDVSRIQNVRILGKGFDVSERYYDYGAGEVFQTEDDKFKYELIIFSVFEDPDPDIVALSLYRRSKD